LHSIESVCLSVNRSHHFGYLRLRAQLWPPCACRWSACASEDAAAVVGGARGTTNHKSAVMIENDQNNHLQRLQRKTSNSDAELHVHVVSHQSASIRPQRPQLPDQFVCSKLDKFSCCCWWISCSRSIVESDSGDLCGFWQFSAARMAAQRVLCLSCSQPQMYSFGLQSQLVQHQLHQDSGCNFSTSVFAASARQPLERVIYEVVVNISSI
uniref:Secreted protein n=1 Tax=Macrostomum lignano TaxID=282301 RepID=A0A1I8FCF1_9PLAT